MKNEVHSEHKWSAADSLTSLRMLCALCLLWLPMGTAAFYAFYTLAGLTDLFDGWLARRSGTACAFGAKLDSAADLLFYGVMLLRLMPLLWVQLPAALWWVVAVVLLVRLAAYLVAAIKFHCFASIHTRLNKLTGAGVFLLPYAVLISDGVVYCWLLAVVALAASAEELGIHLSRDVYRANTKSFWHTV